MALSGAKYNCYYFHILNFLTLKKWVTLRGMNEQGLYWNCDEKKSDLIMKDIVFWSLKFPLLLEWIFEWMVGYDGALRVAPNFEKWSQFGEKGFHFWRDHKIMAMELKFLLMKECCLIEFWWRFQIFLDFSEETFDVWKLGKFFGSIQKIPWEFDDYSKIPWEFNDCSQIYFFPMMVL